MRVFQIRFVSSTGIISTVLGVLGISGFGPDGSSPLSTNLAYPSGVSPTAANDGSFYVADKFGGSIRLVLSNGTCVVFAGQVGSFGYAGVFSSFGRFTHSLIGYVHHR